MPREVVHPPADAAVRDVLARAARRLRVEHTLRSLAWGPLAVLVAPRRSRRAGQQAAAEIERRDPRFRNVLITADELLTERLRAPDYVAERVLHDAARATAGLDLETVFPLRRAIATAICALAVWLGLVSLAAWGKQRPMQSPAPTHEDGRPQASANWQIHATVVPPSYTGRKPAVLRDPDRIQALEGSALHLRVDTAPPLRVRTPRETHGMAQTPAGVQTATLPLTESGYVAFEQADDGSDARSRRLIVITVVPDRVPNVQITSPARDLLLPDARHGVAIAGVADDDLELTRLELRYTTISGSGEQFDFREGTSPIAVTRETASRWLARGELPLASLGLEPGDSVIYRLVAVDRRGAGGIGTSDTYMIDIAAPGQPTLSGFELPPDRDRQGISQQMVLLKIERLHARRAALTLDQLREEALGIAAEQRTVRATFTFMMGGEVEDEEEEAAHSHEIEEGRLENRARRDMLDAVRHMTVVEARLTAADTGGALPPARAAVAALERAFGRRRYFLRTLPVRSRIDPSRRLSGELAEARDSMRSIEPSQESPQGRAGRAAVAELLALSALAAIETPTGTKDASARLARAAERVLALDPSAPDLQTASLRLARRAGSVSSGSPIASARDDLRAALDILLVRARRFAPAPVEPPPASGSLRGRWLSAIEAAERR